MNEADEASSRKAPSSISVWSPGAQIGRYELVVPLREDDAGSAWLAHEKTAAGTERLVVLRTASPGLAGDERFRELLRQEVKLASGVAHPNVAQVLELGSEPANDPVLFVASEWVEGETLAELRAATTGATGPKGKKLAIPPAIVLRVLADACAGLHAAHLLRDRGGGLLNVVHGDVSPKSIVIATNGAARVIDLGFMKARARHAGTANLAWSDGSRPPGQRIDRHADVWGIGAILAQALADAAGVSADGSGPAAPTLVSELVLRARSSDPVERFATAAEMQGAIEATMMTLGMATTRATVAAFVKERVGARTVARAEAVRASRTRAPLVLSIPTPAVDSVRATVQSVRPEGVRPVVSTPAGADTASAISRTPAPATPSRPFPVAPRRGRAALFVAGFGVAVLGSGASGYLALRGRAQVPPAAAPAAILSPAPPPPAPSCPAGMVEVAASAEHARFCLDAAPVTTEAYKTCSDAGDCKRAAIGNRWAGITAKDQAAYDPLCHERDPRSHAKEPMNCVDRDMAALYCTAHGARLPTEAEATLATHGVGPGASSEWTSRPEEAPTTRSYAIGFRCARSL